jgi:hypothetical protein
MRSGAHNFPKVLASGFRLKSYHGVGLSNAVYRNCDAISKKTPSADIFD